MERILKRLRETRVLENYSFMTALGIFSALIGLIIYPYVIRMTVRTGVNRAAPC